MCTGRALQLVEGCDILLTIPGNNFEYTVPAVKSKANQHRERLPNGTGWHPTCGN